MLNASVVKAADLQKDIIKCGEDFPFNNVLNPIDFNEFYCEELQDLVLKMIDTDPKQRPSIDEIKASLIQKRNNIDKDIIYERKWIENDIAIANETLENNPNDQAAQKSKKRGEDNLAEESITHSMYLEILKEGAEELYPDNDNPIRKMFNEMYARETPAIEEQKKIWEAESKEKEIRILI